MTSNPEKRPTAIPPAVWAATFLVALAGVCLEVALVRVFALLFRYHYVFLLVSVAVCGLGLGGLVRTYLPERWCRLWLSALLFGLSIPAVLLLLFASPLAHRLVSTAWLPLVPLVPFLFAGVFLSDVFRRYAALSGALYFADLSGAALAALLVIPLLQGLGGIGTCFLLAALLCAGSFLLARDAGARARTAALAGAVVCAALLLANPRLGWVDLPPLPANADDSQVKPLLRDTAPGSEERIIATRWSAFARTDMTRMNDPDTRFLYTDGDTPTNMIRFDGDLSKVQGLMGQIGFLPYPLGRPQSVLCIGPGAGMDVLLARLGGAKKIVGAEISGDILRLMEEEKEYNGSLYHQPGVQVHLADGRSFVARSREKYDLIYSALTQSATSARAGIALAESYIHTRDAFRVYLDHLTERGTYALVMQHDGALARAFVTAVSVLSEDGKSAADACKHLVIARVPPERFAGNPYRYILLMRKAPFTRDDAVPITRIVGLMGLNALYLPYSVDFIPPFSTLARGEKSLDEFIRGYTIHDPRTGRDEPANITPRTDDQPFFLDMSWQMPLPLVRLVWSIGFATALAALWLGVRRRRGGLVDAARGAGASVYFALLGMGFMLLEVPLIQHFILLLGHPVRALALVLFALLLGTAAGSRWSQRWPAAALPLRVFVALAAVVVLILVYRAALPAIAQAVLPHSLLVRGAVSVLLLLPLGVLLGMPFPSGIRWAERDHPEDVPWFWGMNGLASVLGSGLAMALAWKSGFSAAILAAAATYAVAAGLALAAKSAAVLEAPAAVTEPDEVGAVECR